MAEYFYTIAVKENGVWNQLQGFVRPFYDAETLDESLDHGKITLSCSFRNKPIPPFTPIKITIQRNGSVIETIYRLVSNSAIRQRAFAWNVGKNLYDHTIETVELTKLLERDICDSMTFTNALAHDYTAGAGIIKYKFEIVNPSNIAQSMSDQIENDFTLQGNYYSPCATGSTISIVDYIIEPGYLTYIKYTDTYAKIYDDDGNEVPNGSIVAVDKNSKIYKIVYTGIGYVDNVGTDPTPFTATWTYTIEYMSIIPQKTQYTIKTVLERILSAGITRREGIDAQKYSLAPAIAQKYENMLAPEFFITRSTMFEALLQVGGYIHAIPRLLWDESEDKPAIITFDELGGETERTITAPLEGFDSSIGMDEYCGEIDSTVENLVNTTDKIQGSITDPFPKGYKTVRCETGNVEISNDTAIILLEHPIYRIVKVQVGYIDDANVAGDITPYIFEAAEYGALSSYDDVYPYSKAYALTYTQGDNKITGLSFKLTDAISPAFQKPALNNILERIGYPISTNFAWKNLAFRVTYVPIISARLTQKKSYAGEFANGNTIIYNQSANTVENEFYGENMKGAIAKMGNRVEHRTYRFANLTDVPKCGELVDGMYVSMVEREFEQNWIRATITLTPDFNKLAEYFAINSNYRLFDVSEKQSIDRFVHYDETIMIGDDSEERNSGITRIGMSRCSMCMMNAMQISYESGLAALSRGVSGNTYLHNVALPCVSAAFGNSLYFTFQYPDNFSAGYNSNYLNANKNVQQLVSYGDVYGEIEQLQIKISDSVKTFGWEDQQTSEDGQGLANSLPQITSDIFDNVINGSIFFDYTDHAFVIKKDSRERLNVTIQLHFVANRKSIVIGTQLGQNNSLITKYNPEKAPALYLLPKRVNMLDSTLDLTGAYKLRENTDGLLGMTQKNQFLLSSFQNTTPETYKAWALVDPTNNKYYIAENIELKPGDSSLPVYFTA